MKKYFYILLSLVALAGFTACSDDELVGTHNLDNSVSIIKQDVCFDAEGGQGTITFEAPGTATVKSSADWCHTSVSGTTVNVSVDANTEYEGRNAVVTITCGNDSREVSVVQNGIIILFKYESCTLDSIAAKGGNITIKRQISTDPVTCTSNVEWAKVTETEQGYVITVDENKATSSRKGKITFSAPTHSNSAAYTIIQKGSDYVAPVLEGTYNITYYKSNTESDANLVSATAQIVKDANGNYSLTGFKDNLSIPFVYDEKESTFTVVTPANAGSYNGGYGGVLIAYAKGTSNYITYTVDSKYNVIFKIELDKSTNKHTISLVDTGDAIGGGAIVTGMSIYQFTKTEFIKDNRGDEIIKLRKLNMVQK